MKRFWLDWRRRKALRRVADETIEGFLKHGLPTRRQTIETVELLALDIETTGLDPRTADILSIGWVVIKGGVIELSTAQRMIVSSLSEVGQSATIHGLTDTEVSTGIALHEAISQVVEAAAGRVLVVHHAGLDKVLLDRAVKACFGVPFLIPIIDTLAMAHRKATQQHHLGGPAELRLSDLREQYGLPQYSAHDSTVDALATAELLLAMLEHHHEGANTRVWRLASF
ncbi:MAG: exonuclease domain-containing protein [Pseudomonadota bacterium]